MTIFEWITTILAIITLVNTFWLFFYTLKDRKYIRMNEIEKYFINIKNESPGIMQNTISELVKKRNYPEMEVFNGIRLVFGELEAMKCLTTGDFSKKVQPTSQCI